MSVQTKEYKQIERIYQAKLKLVTNIYEQIEERKDWIKLLNGDIDELLQKMEMLKEPKLRGIMGVPLDKPKDGLCKKCEKKLGEFEVMASSDYCIECNVSKVVKTWKVQI